jgi:nickel/cobalt exporter
MDNSAWTILQMGLGLGLLHSLDADHIAAVTGMSGPQAERKSAMAFPLYWAAGHSGAIVVVAIGVLLLGLAVPYRMSELAESAVAYMLIVIGVAAWFQLACEQSKSSRKAAAHMGANKATAVGLLHGCAGSAPVLALIPIATLQSPMMGVAYILLFCVGVSFSMLILGRLLALTATKSNNRLETIKHWLRPTFATFPIALGIYLIAFA